MKTLLFIVVLISCSISSIGQSRIIGRVNDQTGHLPAVHVALYRDSTIAKATTTDSLGYFKFEQVSVGGYRLSASMVGYKSYNSPAIFVEGDDVLTLSDIILKEDSYTLDVIEVIAEKPLLEQQSDRMIINLGESVTAAGNTVLEILQKSPGVMVNRQSNTIAINGKSGARIMMNGKLIQAPADVVMQMLEGMSASSVEKIELLLTPPSKYDADGGGGIIHIVTNQQVDFGTRSAMAFTLGAHWAETLGAAVTVNHRGKNIVSFLDYSLIRNHNLHKVTVQRQSNIGGDVLTVFDSSRRENVTTQQNLNAGIEWNLKENTLLKILIGGYKRSWQLDAVARNQNLHADSTTKTAMTIEESNIWQSASASIGLQRRVNAKSTVDVAFDYLFYHNNNPSNYDAVADVDISLSKTTPIHIFIGKADYRSNTSSSFSWETGVKAVTSSLNNDVNVSRLYGGIWKNDPAFTSHSTLSEDVLAIYVGTQWMPDKQWQINSGLRYEYTHTVIASEMRKDVERKYGYLFPSISAKKKISSRKEFYVSYTRRLTRPTYNDIAPYVFFWGPNSFSAGNTALYPALSDGITLGYNFRPWAISLQRTHTQKDIVMMQPETDTAANLILRSQNMKYLNTVALTTSYSLLIAPWWEMQSTVVAQYQVLKTMHSYNKITCFGLNASLMNVIKLPKDFSIEISGTYQSKTLSGISYFLPLGSLNAGIQKKLGQSGALTLSVDDILYTNAWKIKTRSPDDNLDVYFHYNWHNQFVRLTYTWNIGNTKLKSVKLKSASEEERQRVSN